MILGFTAPQVETVSEVLTSLFSVYIFTIIAPSTNFACFSSYYTCNTHTCARSAVVDILCPPQVRIAEVLLFIAPAAFIGRLESMHLHSTTVVWGFGAAVLRVIGRKGQDDMWWLYWTLLYVASSTGIHVLSSFMPRDEYAAAEDAGKQYMLYALHHIVPTTLFLIPLSLISKQLLMDEKRDQVTTMHIKWKYVDVTFSYPRPAVFYARYMNGWRYLLFFRANAQCAHSDHQVILREREANLELERKLVEALVPKQIADSLRRGDKHISANYEKTTVIFIYLDGYHAAFQVLVPRHPHSTLDLPQNLQAVFSTMTCCKPQNDPRCFLLSRYIHTLTVVMQDQSKLDDAIKWINEVFCTIDDILSSKYKRKLLKVCYILVFGPKSCHSQYMDGP